MANVATRADLCRACRIRAAKPVRKDGRVVYRRRYCDVCYRTGTARALSDAWQGADPRITDRPDRLKDTGYRIVDAMDTLVHPDGTVETPVPKWLHARRYWFAETTRAGLVVLKVYRVAGPIDAYKTGIKGVPCRSHR